MKRQCGNCRFWDADAEGCHRHAPQPLHWQFFGLCLAIARRDPEAEEVVGYSGGNADFPRTHANDWCGEHEPKEMA